jgi:hypothetical protein
MVNSKQIREATVFYEGDNQARWLDAIGNNVTKYEMECGQPMDDTTGDPLRFVDTIVEAGAGDTLTINSLTAGKKLLITCAGNEFDGICMTLRGEAFQLAAGKPCYFGIKMTMSNIDCDFVVGLFETLTAYTAAAAHTIVGANVDGAGFLLTTAGTIRAQSWDAHTILAAAVAHATGDASAHIYEVEWTGSLLNFYYDGTLVLSSAVTPTTGALTPVIDFRNGSAAVRTLTVEWMRAISIG